MKKLVPLISILLCAPAAFAATAVLNPGKDNTLYETPDGSLSNGAGAYFFVGRTGARAGEVLRRGVMAFDIAGAIPAGAIIDSAKLTLSLSGAVLTTPLTMEVHRLLKNWGEGNSNAGDPGGNGAASQTGDATWLHTSFATAFWTTPGGDFAPSVSGNAVVSGVGFYDFTGSGLASDVQSWLDTPSANAGWIVLGDEVSPNSAKRFDSSENFFAANRPKLTITYTVPEPASALLWLGGFAVLASRRSRSRQRA